MVNGVFNSSCNLTRCECDTNTCSYYNKPTRGWGEMEREKARGKGEKHKNCRSKISSDENEKPSSVHKASESLCAVSFVVMRRHPE